MKNPKPYLNSEWEGRRNRKQWHKSDSRIIKKGLQEYTEA